MTKDRKGPIAACVKSSMEKYFHDLNGEKVSGVYEMVLHEMEKPLLEIVMKHAKSNQCKGIRYSRHQPQYPAQEAQAAQARQVAFRKYAWGADLFTIAAPKIPAPVAPA